MHLSVTKWQIHGDDKVVSDGVRVQRTRRWFILEERAYRWQKPRPETKRKRSCAKRSCCCTSRIKVLTIVVDTRTYSTGRWAPGILHVPSLPAPPFSPTTHLPTRQRCKEWTKKKDLTWFSNHAKTKFSHSYTFVWKKNFVNIFITLCLAEILPWLNFFDWLNHLFVIANSKMMFNFWNAISLS